MRKFRFKGEQDRLWQDPNKSYCGYVIGEIYDYRSECPEGGIQDTSYYVNKYPKDWQEVTEEEKVTLTDTEKIVLIDFLNDHFEEFCKFIGSSTTPEETYIRLTGTYTDGKISTLIDKIEKL